MKWVALALLSVLGFIACGNAQTDREVLGPFGIPLPNDAEHHRTDERSSFEEIGHHYRTRYDYDRLSEWYAARMPVAKSFQDWEWCNFKNLDDNARHLIYQSADRNKFLFLIIKEDNLFGQFNADGSKVKVRTIYISLRNNDQQKDRLCR